MPGSDCARTVYCGAEAASIRDRRLSQVGPECQGDKDSLPAGCRTCIAGNNLIEIKQKLRNLQTYRCDLFEDPQNPSQYCDPKNMVRGSNGVWVGDCLGTDASTWG